MDAGARVAMALVLALGALSAAGQKLYKWVDDDGNVHYSDQVPPDHVDQAREQLNEQGIVVERVDRAKTEAEIAAEKAARAAAIAEAQRRAEQERADRALLAQYASEQDILRARDQRIDALERSIQAAEAYMAGQRKGLAQLLERAANNERQGRPISEALQSSIDSTREQIAEQSAFVDEKEAEKAEIAAFYEQELARYREVLARREALAEAR